MTPRTVILSPHHDDVALFCAFNAIRYQARIVVVTKSVKQQRDGITDLTRRGEELRAALELGCTVEFWDYPDTDPDWDTIEGGIAAMAPERVFVPAFEDEGGNAQHNELCRRTYNALGRGRAHITRYLTYTTAGKSTWGQPVEFEPDWVPRKLRALASHVSQASLPSCLEHFLRDQHEYVAP